MKLKWCDTLQVFENKLKWRGVQQTSPINTAISMIKSLFTPNVREGPLTIVWVYYPEFKHFRLFRQLSAISAPYGQRKNSEMEIYKWHSSPTSQIQWSTPNNKMQNLALYSPISSSLWSFIHQGNSVKPDNKRNFTSLRVWGRLDLPTFST